MTVSDDNNNDIVTNAVQIDAAVNPGNSGGPTFNAAGQVIGINSSIASTTTSSGTAGSIGIGFAIPSNLVKRVANEIIDNGTVQHVALGVTIKSSTVEADGVTRGCTQVQSVVDNSPAAKAGVKAGDSIVAFNGKAVNNNYSLLGYVRASAMNDKVTLTVVRDGNTMELDVTLDQEESQRTSPTARTSRTTAMMARARTATVTTVTAAIAATEMDRATAMVATATVTEAACSTRSACGKAQTAAVGRGRLRSAAADCNTGGDHPIG